MATPHCYCHLAVQNGNFTLLLTCLVVKNGNYTLLLTSSSPEWQLADLPPLLTTSGPEWQFYIATDMSSGQEWQFHSATDI